jgi:hypothetical protein
MPVVEQAKGILMAQYGWPEDQAFDALRRVSQHTNVKLRDVAARIVASTVNAAPSDGRPAPGRRRRRQAEPADDIEVIVTIPRPPGDWARRAAQG